MYAAKMELSRSRTRSTRWKLSRRTSSDTAVAATGTLTYRLIPASSNPAAIPANSAHVVPTLATTRKSNASAVARMPYRSRISPVSPCPVTTPIRAPSSWKSTRAAVETTSTQSSA